MNPTLPADWPGFDVTRRFRGTEYRIRVEKQPGAIGRVRALDVDGVHTAGNVIPLPIEAGGTIQVTAHVESDG